MDKDTVLMGVDQIRSVARQIEKDILTAPVLENKELIFDRLKIKTLTGIEFKNSLVVFHRKGGQIRRYKVGNYKKGTVGQMEERELTVYESVLRYPDNIQNYREKIGFNIAGVGGNALTAPSTEFHIRKIGGWYAEEVITALFFGDIQLGDDNPLGIYDGYNTLINKEITKGQISKANHNYIEIDPIVKRAVGQESENWDVFQGFYNALPAKLKSAPLVMVYCDPAVRQLIIEGYLRSFIGLQTPDAGKDDFRFVGMDNIQLVGHSLIGQGTRLIATLPYNFEFGLDSESDFNQVFVTQNPDDANELTYQVQSAQGCRIRSVMSSSFCVSSGSNKAMDDLNGDYQKDSITLVSNPDVFESVTKSPDKETYEKGETVTLTATAKSGKKFVMWSDGATINPRAIVTNGFPITIEAVGADA